MHVEMDKPGRHEASNTFCMRFLLGRTRRGEGPLAGPVAVGVLAVAEGLT